MHTTMRTVRVIRYWYWPTVQYLVEEAWWRYPTLWWGWLLLALLHNGPVHPLVVFIPVAVAWVHLWLSVAGDIRRECAE
jgi:hypothetical protein